MSDLDYYTYRNHLADELRHDRIDASFRSIFDATRDLAGVDEGTAGRWAERFCRDIARHLEPELRRARTPWPPRLPPQAVPHTRRAIP